MRILDFFRNRQQKSENISLIVKGDSSVRPYTPQKKKIRTIVDFVENALISNGGNYEDIYQKLLALSEFAKHAKEYGIECNLSGIDVTLSDFFTEQSDIKYFPIKDKPHVAFYAKKEGWNYYNYRGVTIMQDEQEKNRLCIMVEEIKMQKPIETIAYLLLVMMWLYYEMSVRQIMTKSHCGETELMQSSHLIKTTI